MLERKKVKKINVKKIKYIKKKSQSFVIKSKSAYFYSDIYTCMSDI